MQTIKSITGLRWVCWILAVVALLTVVHSPMSHAEKEFCNAPCTQRVGGEKCPGVCQSTKGHSGKHLCIKLHEF